MISIVGRAVSSVVIFAVDVDAAVARAVRCCRFGFYPLLLLLLLLLLVANAAWHECVVQEGKPVRQGSGWCQKSVLPSYSEAMPRLPALRGTMEGGGSDYQDSIQCEGRHAKCCKIKPIPLRGDACVLTMCLLGRERW